MVRTAEAITLYYNQGRSDKQYVLELVNSGPELRGAGWSVRFAFGRRGSTFQSGRKVSEVSEGLARKEFCRLLEAKLAKGYEVEAVTVRGPSINGTLPRYWQGAAPRFEDAARQVVATSTPSTPRRVPVRAQPPAPKPAPKPPAPAPAVDRFAPVKRKIRLS